MIQSTKSIAQEERLRALYVLLYKDLLQGHNEDYIRDYKLLPADAVNHSAASGKNYAGKPAPADFTWSGKQSDDSYSCPSTIEIARKLQKNAEDPHGSICPGDFVKFRSPGSGSTWFSAIPSPDGSGNKKVCNGEAVKLILCVSLFSAPASYAASAPAGRSPGR